MGVIAGDDRTAGRRLPARTRRALEEVMTVTPDIGRARGADDLVLVTSGSGREYLVDLRGGGCECPDARHRAPEYGCKHVRRARMACGVRPVSVDELAAVDADPALGDHAGGPVVVSADGGVITGPDESDDAVAEDDCACDDLPEGVPCWACYREGDAAFDR